MNIAIPENRFNVRIIPKGGDHMADKKGTGKPEGSKGGGGLFSGLVIIWLLLVTGVAGFAAWMVINDQMAGKDRLETRISELEKRAQTVKGKIGASGDLKDTAALESQLASLEKRLAQTEQGMANLSGNTAVPVVSTTTAPSANASGACDCNDLVSRLQKVEADIVACRDGVKTPAVSQKEAEPAPKKAAVRSASKSRSRKKKQVARARKNTYKSPAYESRSYPEQPLTTVSVPPSRPRDSVTADDLSPSSSVYDISMRIGPSYGYSSNEQRGLSKLAPGAAVYPSLNSPDLSTSSTYMDNSLPNY